MLTERNTMKYSTAQFLAIVAMISLSSSSIYSTGVTEVLSDVKDKLIERGSVVVNAVAHPQETIKNLKKTKTNYEKMKKAVIKFKKASLAMFTEYKAQIGAAAATILMGGLVWYISKKTLFTKTKKNGARVHEKN